MRATVMYQAGDVRVENVPDPVLREPTDAIVRVTSACICGSDLWPYQSMPFKEQGRRMGHEFIGIVEEVGSEVSGFERAIWSSPPSCGRTTRATSAQRVCTHRCRHGGGWGAPGLDAGQGEVVRVPLAQGTLVKLPVAPDSALMPSLLTLSDVFCTGHHGAVTSGVRPGHSVTVVGDGAVGLCAVLAAKRLGAEQIVLMGRHTDRTDLGREFGATDVVAERGEEGEIEFVSSPAATARTPSSNASAPSVTGDRSERGPRRRCRQPTRSFAVHRGPVGFETMMRNITLTGGAAPARAYIEELMPDILDGTVEPGRVFDRTIGLDEVPDGYKAMAERESLKVLIQP